eukprot:5575024-Amphidinium_carterae.1
MAWPARLLDARVRGKMAFTPETGDKGKLFWNVCVDPSLWEAVVVNWMGPIEYAWATKAGKNVEAPRCVAVAQTLAFPLLQANAHHGFFDLEPSALK